jgi:hypothetical protein
VFIRPPCDEAVIQSGDVGVPCAVEARTWVLAATVIGSSMAFIDGTVVNVALPALQTSFHAAVVNVQWVVESYGLFLGALILVGGSLGDLFGRRSVSSCVIFGAATNVPLPRRISTRPRLTRFLNGPANGNAADLESRNEAVFGRELVVDLQGSIGDLAGQDRFDA